jgi:hypothetical protein
MGTISCCEDILKKYIQFRRLHSNIMYDMSDILNPHILIVIKPLPMNYYRYKIYKEHLRELS